MYTYRPAKQYPLCYCFRRTHLSIERWLQADGVHARRLGPIKLGGAWWCFCFLVHFAPTLIWLAAWCLVFLKISLFRSLLKERLREFFLRLGGLWICSFPGIGSGILMQPGALLAGDRWAGL